VTSYGKTENLFVRDESTHKLVIGATRSPAVPQIKDFIVTEKIDGTNIRVILDWAYDEEHDAGVRSPTFAAGPMRLLCRRASSRRRSESPRLGS
jgi:hypothetical protein